MARVVWILLCSLMAAGIELVVGGYGLCLPVFAAVAFCLLVAQGARRSLPWLVLAGAVLDLSYARALPAQAVLLVLLALLAAAWRRHGDCIHPLAQTLPGIAVGGLSGAVLVLLVSLPGLAPGWGTVRQQGWILLQGLGGGAVLTPFAMALLDGGARRLGLPLYARARNRREE